jgi:uncharacterized protein DUF6510
MQPLDGNAIAGALYEAFGGEMTTRTGVCEHCGAVGLLPSFASTLRVHLALQLLDSGETEGPRSRLPGSG